MSLVGRVVGWLVVARGCRRARVSLVRRLRLPCCARSVLVSPLFPPLRALLLPRLVPLLSARAPSRLRLPLRPSSSRAWSFGCCVLGVGSVVVLLSSPCLLLFGLVPSTAIVHFGLHPHHASGSLIDGCFLPSHHVPVSIWGLADGRCFSFSLRSSIYLEVVASSPSLSSGFLDAAIASGTISWC